MSLYYFAVLYVTANFSFNISSALTNMLIPLIAFNNSLSGMNRIVVLFIVLFITNTSFGQHFTPVDEGSEIDFKVRNFGVNVSGSFKGLEGEIIFFPDSLSAAHFNVTIDVKTIHTGINQRDNHLRSEDYFEVARYPLIHFTSARITTSTSKAYLFVFGKLTIKDVTKEISFPFKVTPQNDGYIFEGEFKLNRRDYNVGGGSITMGDSVTLSLKVLAKTHK